MDFHMDVRIDEVFDEGAYPAVLANVEEKETKFGNRLMWTFDLQGRNAEVVGFTSMSPSSKANAYAWAAAIMGGDINPSVGWGPKDVIGRACVVILEVVEDALGAEKNKVAKVKPPKNGEVPSRSGGRPDGPDFGRAGF